MSNQPSFIAYTLRDRGADKSPFWFRIGVAFAHKSSGFTIHLNALPIGERIVLRLPKDDVAGNPAENSEALGEFGDHGLSATF